MKKTINFWQFVSLLIFFASIVLYIAILNSDMNSFFDNIQLISIVGLVFLVFICVSWKNNYYRMISPYFIFTVTLYLCLCGQSVMWAFGLKAGYRDLQTWGKLFTSYDICKGLVFSYCCLTFLHLVVMMNVKNKKCLSNIEVEKNSKRKSIPEKTIYIVLSRFGIVMSIVFLAPYLINFISTYKAISTFGYVSQYDNVSYGIGSAMSKISEFFPVGVLTLFFALGKKNDYNKNNYKLKLFFTIILVLCYLICELVVGQRTGIILFSLSFLFIYFKDKKITTKFMITGIVLFIILMSLMRLIDLARSNNIVNISDFLTYFISFEDNPIIDFLGDIGWNLMTLLEFQKLMPDVRNYAFGFSYLISLTSIIPNINFWTIHPAYMYGEISSWLRIYLGYHFGLGCTPIAETYYNFGSFGIIVFYLWGKFLVYLNKKYEEHALLSNYFVVLFIGLLLKSCVRSSFVSVFRPMIFYVLIPVLIVKIICSKYKKTR